MKEKTWKTRSTQHYTLFNNPFMKDKIQYLIRNSVRRECHTACDGKDGNGGGNASTTVTKVLIIENGPLRHRYLEKKITIIATRLDLKGTHRLKAKSTEISKLFPNVEPNDKINELLLFHDTKLENSMSSIRTGLIK
jgi:hypothetical protein